MATVPLSATNIRLISGVPFSNDYKHTRWFDTLLEQTTYFEGKPLVHQILEATFQRDTVKTFLSVNKSIDDLRNTNYVMFQNTSYSNKWFYAFVTKLEYVNRGTTYVHVQLDVFQTWKFEMNFKPSYVIREHCKLWNDDGTPVINTVDEGLNYGTDMDNVDCIKHQVGLGYKWLVIVAKTPFHDGTVNAIQPRVIGTPQPLSVYIVPFKDNDSVPNVFVGGVQIPVSSPTDLMFAMYLSDKAVNNIVSLYVTDYTGIPTTYIGGTPDVLQFTNDTNNEVEGVQISDGSGGFEWCLYVKKVKDFLPSLTVYPNKYNGYKAVKESKLLMYPYTQLVMDDFKGNRVVLKNEYIHSNSISITAKGSLGLSNKTSYGIVDYNNPNDVVFEGNLSDENALINNEPNDVPIVTDLLSAYIQGNRNSIRNQKESAIFNGTMGAITGVAGGIVGAGLGNPMGLAMAGASVVQGAGNTVLQIQGINAKIKDIGNVPPQISKMGSNTAYTVGNNYNGVFLIKKQIKDEYIKKLEHFFNMYGYKVNEVKLPNFHTRTKWNYVQTSSCVILGDFNSEDLNEIKAVFDNGITFWHVEDVGNYSLENEVI